MYKRQRNNVEGLQTSEIFNGSVWFSAENTGIARIYCSSVGSPGNTLLAGQNSSGSGQRCQIHTFASIFSITANAQILNTIVAKGMRGLLAVGPDGEDFRIGAGGYINNVLSPSNNPLIVTPPDWENGLYLCVNQDTPAVETTSLMPYPSYVVKEPEAEDMIVGRVISRTEIQVFSGTLFPITEIGRW